MRIKIDFFAGLFRVGLLFVFFSLSGNVLLFAQERTGDPAMAERYVDWAERAIAGGRWQEAEAGLERAQDFADVSSDLSCLLALVRRHENRPEPVILEASRRALETDRWQNHSPEEGRLLEAGSLIRTRAFAEALSSLAHITRAAFAAEASVLRLQALLGLRNLPDFRSEMEKSLERFPLDGRFPRILFKYGADKLPEGDERNLINTCLARLSRYMDTDPDLAYRAVPFIQRGTFTLSGPGEGSPDTAEGRRLVLFYRAQGGADPEALIPALNLGLIDEVQAVTELFGQEAPSGGEELRTLDRKLMASLWDLLRHNQGRENFRRNLSRYSGVISEDEDQDGYPESWTRYEAGQIREYRYDADQDGLLEWRIDFAGGEPSRAEVAMSGETGQREGARIVWDPYPQVLRVVFDGLTYHFNPRGFLLTPIRFTPLIGAGSSAPLYPLKNALDARLTRGSLLSFARTIERQSGEFKGALERIELDRGIPLNAVVTRGGRTVSVTEYRQGRPVLQRIDLDLDGRMETTRRFRPAPPVLAGGDEQDGAGRGFYPFDFRPETASSESDWDGDGVCETGEEYLPDGSVARSWDINRDGIKEYTIITPAE
ncbi:MAG: hypothetical protein LBT16_11465 [Treponema sp.]|nr:hypothetical protein [Treponema sp.]